MPLFPWLEGGATMNLRVSTATASLLHIKKYRIDAVPTTLYFMLPGECSGRCAYCTHASGHLSRVEWPEFPIDEVVEGINKSDAKRICIQSPYGEGYAKMLVEVAEMLKGIKPISASISALSREELKALKEAGVERVGVGLDCATPEIFKKWKKGVPSWDAYMETLRNAKEIFGRATCHLIIGLGESDEEAINLMEGMKEKGIDIALFALFVGKENRVELTRYRAMQVARYAIFNGGGEFFFDDAGRLREMNVKSIDGNAFLTSGCPHCNRPFYNERVTKIYNYPRPLNEREFERAVKEAEKYARIHVAAGQK